MFHNIITVSVWVFRVFAPVLTILFALHLRDSPIADIAALSWIMTPPQKRSATRRPDVDTIMGTHIPKVFSTRRKECSLSSLTLMKVYDEVTLEMYFNGPHCTGLSLY